MKNKLDTFSTYHPAVNLFYFTVVIGISMFITHPVILFISFVSAVMYHLTLLAGKDRTSIRKIVYLLPIMLLIAFMNPLFNHYGATILFYFKNGNPVTMESIVYGLVLSVLFMEIVSWFSCYNRVMTTDKFLYLFGRIIPKFALILSMTIRFIPLFQQRLTVIRNGQKCMGRDLTNGNLIKRIGSGIRIFSILLTWSLENAIDTADSMKSRGYGLKGRTSFSVYHFDRRDSKILLMMITLTGIVFYGAFQGALSVQYNPVIKVKGVPFTFESIITYTSFLFLCLMPVFIEIMESVKWNWIQKNKREETAGGYRLWQSLK